MVKPEVTFVKGILEVKAAAQVDTDADGKPSLKLGLDLELDAAEIVSEIAKKDLPWLEALVSQLKV